MKVSQLTLGMTVNKSLSQNVKLFQPNRKTECCNPCKYHDPLSFRASYTIHYTLFTVPFCLLITVCFHVFKCSTTGSGVNKCPLVWGPHMPRCSVLVSLLCPRVTNKVNLTLCVGLCACSHSFRVDCGFLAHECVSPICPRCVQLAPENTMMSFNRSIACGVTAFETDVQLR